MWNKFNIYFIVKVQFLSEKGRAFYATLYQEAFFAKQGGGGSLRQASIETKNHLMAFSDSSWQDCPDTGRSTGAYIILFQGGPIDHGTHVPGPVAQSSVES